jgi:hypothetical protein
MYIKNEVSKLTPRILTIISVRSGFLFNSQTLVWLDIGKPNSKI